MDDISNILVAVSTIIVMAVSAFLKNKKKTTDAQKQKFANFDENIFEKEIFNADTNSFSEDEVLAKRKKSFLQKTQRIDIQKEIEEEHLKEENKEKPVFDLKQAVVYNEILNRKYF